MGERTATALSRSSRITAHPAVVAAGVAAAMLGPILLWGALARGAVVEDITRRETAQRVLTARLAANAVQSAVAEAGRRLDLVASRSRLRAALVARDTSELERHLADLRRGTGYATTGALDPSGRTLARHPAAPEAIGQSFADRDYYAGALGAPATFLSEAVVSRITGQTLVVAALAVRDGDRVLGLLVATLTPAQLLAEFSPLDARLGRELHLVDQKSRVIASTDAGLAPLSELPARAAVTQGAGPATAASAATDELITYVPVEGVPWVLVVTDDASIALAAQRDLDRKLIAGAAGTMVLALAAAGGIAYLFAIVTRQRAILADREAVLERTNEDLQSASRHKSEFLASMSHELRTPLNAILGFGDLLEEQLASALSDRQKRYLRNIHDAGSHLLALINDVLDLAKVEAGRVDLRREVVTLGSVTAPVVSSTRAAAEQKGVTFAAEIDEAARISVDPARLRQILYNLLSNAVKFTPEGGEVRLRAAVRDAELSIEVADTGIGIPRDRQERVFGTFERLHEGRSDAPGTGLGLALTRSLVELHGGSIAFTSEEGRGTSFHVTLPGVTPGAAAGGRLLVVEDDRRDAELIVALAAKAGLGAEVVGSSGAATAALSSALPVAIVLDLRLPDGRGQDVLKALKADPRTSAIPVIVVTVEDDEGTSRANGADDHLTKPIDHARLDEWLRRLAARSGQKEVARARAPR